MHAGYIRKRLATAVTPADNIVTGALLFFAGPQAVVTKFHDISPAKARILEHTTVARFCQEISEGSIDHENYICGGIDKPYAARPDVIEKPVVIVVPLLFCFIGADNSDGTRD